MSPRIRLALVPVLLCLAFLAPREAIAETAVADKPLPTDPALVTGALPNGLRYIVRQHNNPAGRAVMWIHFHTGSLNETDPQRGIAHYLEHMAFNGSENFPPGSVVPFFQSLGMTFGRDQNAFTSFDQTVYQLSLPDVQPETLKKGLTFFADVTHRLLLRTDEIEAERGIIQEERRTRLSGRQRVMNYMLERMAPGSIFGFRLPIGTEETIGSVQQADFKDYYGRWYGASNATLIVVADTDPQAVIAQLTEAFGDAPAKPRPTPQDIGIKAYTQDFAIVASDPEIKSEEVRIARVEPARPPTLTEAQLRTDWVLALGTSAFNRRMADKVARGGAAFSSLRVSADNEVGTMWSTDISARAKPGQWRQALEAAALELQRARTFGFTQREIDDVRKELISSAEWAVETEPTVTLQALAGRINGRVASGEPISSPAQRLELMKRLLPTITLEEVAAAFAKELDPTRGVAFSAILPAGDGVPSEAELLSIGQAALKVQPEREAELARAGELLPVLPAAGSVAEGAEHEASKVWSGWLSNNVRVHHRFMDEQKNDVTVQVSLLGGELFETADNRGVTQAAGLAWGRPATRKLASTDIRELMTGKKVGVRGGGGMGGGGRRGGGGGMGGSGDSVSLTVSGSPGDLEHGLQLAYLLLTEPKIEPSAFEEFQTATRTMLQEMQKNPMMAGVRAASAAPFPPNEARVQPMTIEQLDRLNVEAAQAWLDRMIKESPIEVTIVGDMPREQALDLAAKYLGALPSRQRVAPGLFAELRKLERPAGPRVVEQVIDTPTQQAFVASGFFGADETNRPDVRALNMASRVLSTRMVKQVREEAQLVYSIGASFRPGSTFPGFGLMVAAAPTDPGKVQPLVDKLAEMYEAFARSGPTEEEMTVARKQFANNFAEQLKQPEFWMGRLSRMTARGVSLDEMMADPEAYQKLTAEQVRETFARYWSKDNSITVVVKPQGPTPTPGGGQ